MAPALSAGSAAGFVLLEEGAAVHICQPYFTWRGCSCSYSLSLSLEDMTCVSVSKIACVCVFVCGSTAVLDVHHLSFPVKAQHLEKYNSLYTVSLSSLPSCPLCLPVLLTRPLSFLFLFFAFQDCTTSTQRGTGCAATCLRWGQAPCMPTV